jgi:hypothetical protein
MPDLVPNESSAPANRPVEQVVITFFDLPASPSVQRTAQSIWPSAISAMPSECSSPRSFGAFARTRNCKKGYVRFA